MNIRFIQSVGFCGEGYVTKIIEESDRYLYYYDECERWCSILRNMEGLEYVKEEEMAEEMIVVGRCDLCDELLGDDYILLHKWVFHPKCADIVDARLEHFASIIIETTDEEFETWLEDNS